MPNIKVPREISLGSFKNLQVYLVKDLVAKAEEEGCLSITENCLCVDPVKPAKNMRDTLIHELVHLIDKEYQLFSPDNVEAETERLTHGLSQLCDLLDIEFDWSDIPLMRTDCPDFHEAVGPLFPMGEEK